MSVSHPANVLFILFFGDGDLVFPFLMAGLCFALPDEDDDVEDVEDDDRERRLDRRGGVRVRLLRFSEVCDIIFIGDSLRF